MIDIEAWVKTLLSAWQAETIISGAEQATACFSETIAYQETPFAKVLNVRKAVKQYWLDMLSSQKDVRYSYDIVSWHDAKLVLNWRVCYADVTSGQAVSLNGISKGLFKDDGLCYDWREWWHKE